MRAEVAVLSGNAPGECLSAAFCWFLLPSWCWGCAGPSAGFELGAVAMRERGGAFWGEGEDATDGL